MVGQGKDRGMLFCFTLCCMDLENGDGCKSTFGMQLGENDRPTESLVTTKVWLSKYCLAKSVNELAWVRHKKFTSKVLHIHSMYSGLTSFLTILFYLFMASENILICKIRLSLCCLVCTMYTVHSTYSICMSGNLSCFSSVSN